MVKEVIKGLDVNAAMYVCSETGTLARGLFSIGVGGGGVQRTDQSPGPPGTAPASLNSVWPPPQTRAAYLT